MVQLKKIPEKVIYEVRNSPLDSGLAFKQFGKHIDIRKYSDEEITEMFYGIYKDKKMILVDGDYFIDLNDVIETVCVLEKTSYIKHPTQKEFLADIKNHELISERYYSNIQNVRTFYISHYFLITNKNVSELNTNRHEITNLLCKVGAIKRGRSPFHNFFGIRNDYKTLFKFGEKKYFPKDLYYPIKQYINNLFFDNGYRIDNFKVETTNKYLLEMFAK